MLTHTDFQTMETFESPPIPVPVEGAPSTVEETSPPVEEPASVAILPADVPEIPHNPTPTVLASSHKIEIPTSLRDDTYYLYQVVFEVSGNICHSFRQQNMIRFQVEQHLFMVPRHFFEQSTNFFSPIFASQGNGDQNPVRLDGVERIDFLALLKLAYPL